MATPACASRAPVAAAYLVRSSRFQAKRHESAEIEEGTPAGSSPDVGGSGDPLADGAFQECNGLEVEMDVQEYPEGGRNDGVIRRIGRAKYQNLVLKRGMFLSAAGNLDGDLWKWFQDVVAGTRPVRRYDGIVEVLGVADEVVATWTFDRGLPAKIVGPQLNAKTGEIAMKELHLPHKGLRLVTA